MRIFSEKTGKEYQNVEDCLKAEKDFDIAAKVAADKKAKLVKVRKNRAKEVEDAYKDVQAAEKKYLRLRNDFIKDYGSFHMTFSDGDSSVEELLSTFFDFL